MSSSIGRPKVFSGLADVAMADNFYKVGVNAYNEGNFSGAIVWLSQAVKLNRQNWQASLYLAVSLSKVGMTREALVQFERLLKKTDADTKEQVIACIAELSATDTQLRSLQPLQRKAISATA